MVKPTIEFRQHHDVEDPRVDEIAFRQAFIVRARVDQLRADRRITPGEWQAAVDFRATWAIAREISRSEPGMLRIAGSGSEDASTIVRLDAATKLRVVEDTIGRLATALVVACVVEDLPWAAIARHCHRDPHTVRDWTVLAIRAMARAWAGPGRGRAARPLHRSGEHVDAL